MAPEPGQESEEEQVPLALSGRQPVGNDSGPPTTIPTDTMASSCSRNRRPPSTGEGSISTQLAPETLDPCTLRLLWEQRELEIQALRWAIRHGQHAQHHHILQEVAGLPPERSIAPPRRSSHSQDTFLQNQVQKLTLELRAQKEQAQLERECLEAQLAQTTDKLQQLEAELQAYQKSCLLHLAQSSWVGRIIRSQTGSVEVSSSSGPLPFSSSEPTAGEGFRLEDVDWNSIAQRYPNLLTSIHSSSEPKQHQLPSGLDSPGSDSPRKLVERQHKSLEWSTLPCAGTSSSGGADSDSSSCQLVLHPRVQRVIGHPPPAADTASYEQTAVQTKRFSGDSEGGPWGPPHRSISIQTPKSATLFCSLQIVAVSQREKFVRILNRSLQDAADLGGLVLQQRVHDCPVRMFCFPKGTVLEPQHHLTVWGEGTGGIQQQPPFPSGQDPLQFHCGRGCVTLLLDAEGQVLSEYQAPLRVTSGSGIFADNTDWSIDRFPLPEAGAGAHTGKPQCWPRPPRQGRGREAQSMHRRPGAILHLTLGWEPTLQPDCPPDRTRCLMPLPSPRKSVHLRQGPAQLEGTKLAMKSDPLPTISGKCRGVDLGCPIVALSVQSTAESRFGFRFLCCPPITTDLHL
uniref:LTD domain-containing protein n=1 Tax=Cavia porcellus TaxID=10141 RepID=H0UXS2_CAVPO